MTSMTDPAWLGIADAAAALRQGTLTAVELAEATLARIRLLDSALRSFVLVTPERARADAERADRELAAGLDRGPLHGIPYALKDVIDTAGIPTTSHSHLRVKHVPDQDAEVVRRLHEAGAVLVGKTATHEFALGGPSTELPFPPARNPWNHEHIPGASSSGSGAAVAAGLVPLAIGSDTSGSVRGPAGHCGVVGLKPTYGLVSRRGVFPLSYALDHIGPLTRTVRDSALALGVIAGPDKHDPASVDRPPADLLSTVDNGVAGLRIAYARSMLVGDPSAHPDVVAALDAAAGALRELGACVREVRLPDFALFNACGRVIMTAEGYAIHEPWLRERPLEYGRYTYQRLLPGAGLTAADLVQAMRVRQQLADEVSAVLADHSALLAANALAPPPRFGDFGTDWPPPRAATATQTIAFNVTGHPALCLPVGFTAAGLPLGMQVVAAAFAEPTLFRVAAALESHLGLDRRPPGY
jgi:aspartyl-tRNA(Asn)/glutamyl-tRNA(Gln) amidotransferase subunit A